jgi:hypothetical protein
MRHARPCNSPRDDAGLGSGRYAGEELLDAAVAGGALLYRSTADAAVAAELAELGYTECLAELVHAREPARDV